MVFLFLAFFMHLSAHPYPEYLGSAYGDLSRQLLDAQLFVLGQENNKLVHFSGKNI